MLVDMAIFGDLANMSTPEVLKLLGTKTGKLHIWPTSQKHYELHLHEGAVYALREDGVGVGDKTALQKSLSELFDLRRGKFDFNPEAFALLAREFSFTRREVLQLLAASEISETDDKSPVTDRATRFKLSGSAHHELPENIQSFLERAFELLVTGCSAAELADALEMPVPLVQLYLMRLRSLGRVTPVRAYAPGYTGYTPVSSAVTKEVETPVTSPRAEVVPASPIVQPPITQPNTAQQPEPYQSTARQVAARQARPKQTFIRRLLSVLPFGGR